MTHQWWGPPLEPSPYPDRGLGHDWWPLPMSPTGSLCPMVPLVGACCSGCASGQGCSGGDELEHAAALDELHVGAFGFEKALPWSDVEAFDQEVRRLDADVRVRGNAGMKLLWEIEVAGYWPRWRAWFDATKGSWTAQILGAQAIAGKTLAEFEALRTEYNVLVGQFKQAGLETGAGPVDVTDKSPAEKAAEEAGGGIGQGVAAALSTLGQGVVWVGLLGLVGLGLYFGGPILIRRLVA